MNWEAPPEFYAGARLIVGRDSLERMEVGGPREVDAFLLQEVRGLRGHYMRTGNPRVVYQAGVAVADAVKPVRGHLYSFQFSKLQALLAEMILAQGKDASALLAAEYHLETAFETMQRVQALSEDIVRAQVSYALLLSVTRKALGDPDASIRNVQEIARHLKLRKSATEVDLVPLRRQEVIMRQTAEGHRQLAEGAVQYAAAKPKEYYRSLKRVFEFLLNTGRVGEADKLYPEFRRGFAAIAHQVPPISHVSFLKNLGQYFMAKGDASAASGILGRTLLEAGRRNLHGQVRQVNALLEELEAGGTRGRLIPFAVRGGR